VTKEERRVQHLEFIGGTNVVETLSAGILAEVENGRTYLVMIESRKALPTGKKHNHSRLVLGEEPFMRRNPRAEIGGGEHDRGVPREKSELNGWEECSISGGDCNLEKTSEVAL